MRSRETDAPPASRRRMLGALLAGLGAVLAGLVAIPFGLYLRPPRRPGGRQTLFDAAALPPGGALLVRLGSRPLLVFSGEGGKYRAFWARCPHLGCTVAWEGSSGRIVCPCHGAHFDVRGKLLAGPGAGDLAPAAVRFIRQGSGAVLVSEH